MNRALAIAGLVFVSIQGLSAITVYQQPSVWTSNGTNVGFTWTTHVDSGGGGFRTFDNFSLGSSTIINQATWRGIYLDSNLMDASPNTANWTISFYADNAGAPGSLLSSTSLTSGQVSRQTLGTGLFGSTPVTVYEFTALLSGFNAASGTTYWFSPFSMATNFSPLFGWIQGTGGDSSSFQTQLTGGAVTNTFVRSGDRAFSLNNVPEPATSILIGAGLAALAVLRRRSANV